MLITNDGIGYTIQGNKLYIFLNQKWTKVMDSTKNVKSAACFTHTLKR